MTRRLRWMMAGAAGLGLWSAWILWGPAESVRPETQANRRAAPRAAAAPRHAEAVQNQQPVPARQMAAVTAARNPFEAKPWVARREPVKAQPAPPPVVEAPPAPPPPPPPLRLPYRFLGVYGEKAKPPSAILALGERVLLARAGELVEGGFRLDSISARELTFTHVQQNVTLRMSTDGGQP